MWKWLKRAKVDGLKDDNSKALAPILKDAIELRNAGDLDASRKILEEARITFGNDPWIMDNLCRIDVLEGRFDIAIRGWERIRDTANDAFAEDTAKECITITSKQKMNAALLDKISILKGQFRWADVIFEVKNALSDQPDHERFGLELAIAYRENNNFDLSLFELDRLDGILGPNCWVFDNYIRLYLAAGYETCALQAVKKLRNTPQYRKTPEYFVEVLKAADPDGDLETDAPKKAHKDTRDTTTFEIETILMSGLFDARFYRAHLQKYGITTDNSVEHFVTSGAIHSYWPNRYFDPAWYANTQKLSPQINPLVHYISVGQASGVDTCAKISMRDLASFMTETMNITVGVDVLKKAVANDVYVRSVDTDSVDTDSVDRDYDYLVDPVYLTKNMTELGRHDERAAFFNHYPQEVMKEEFRDLTVSPHPIYDFDYIARTLDCEKRKALVEFLKRSEQDFTLSPHPLFDSDFYRAQADILGVEVSEPYYLHYFRTGWKKGLDPHPLFDSEYYRNVLLISSFDKAPLEHYLQGASKFEANASPFVDEPLFNHRRIEHGIPGSHPPIPLRDFVAASKWINPHSEVTGASIGQILYPCEMHELRERDARVMPADLVQIIKECRLAGMGAPAAKDDAGGGTKALSVIALAYNKPIFTILSCLAALRALKNHDAELILVDNCSEFFSYTLISRYLSKLDRLRILRLERNRFFGEGNNIALDKARGERILFLNNDLFLSHDTVTKMSNFLDANPEFGAVSPVFLFPNHTVQEIGGLVSGCGQAIQIGKHMEVDDQIEARIKLCRTEVDYASAACSMVRKSVLQDIGGFDYLYEPFYFEDTDLCARIICSGYKLGVAFDTFVIHLENASTREFLSTGFNDLIDRNRAKFRSRWFGRLEQRDRLAEVPRRALFGKAPSIKASTGRTAVLHSPFALRPGGGEKYFLTMGEALLQDYDVTLAFDEINSTHRLQMVSEDLGVNARDMSLATIVDIKSGPAPDVWIAMCNEIIPPLPPMGAFNVLHCQFPFPLAYVKRHDIGNTLHGYDLIVVNSEFTKAAILEQLKLYSLPTIPVEVVFPPCWDGDLDTYIQRARDKPSWHDTGAAQLLNVGRFFRHGHTKRQDIFLDIFEKLKVQKADSAIALKGNMYGGVDNAEKEFFESLALRASKLDVGAYSNVDKSALDTAYAHSDIYLHCAGFGRYEAYSPHELEHFGITIIEGAINGLFPLVYAHGGPKETLTHLGAGAIYETVDEAVSEIERLLGLSTQDLTAQRVAMVERCEQFSKSAFSARFNALVCSRR